MTKGEHPSDNASELHAARAARIAAINLMEDAMFARRKAEETEQALRKSEERVRRKLESVLSPEGELGDLDLADLIDIAALQRLMDDFYAVAHIPMSIVDVRGQILIAVGWQDICTRFHRAHPETCAGCLESDTVLSSGVPEGQFKLYRCKNNMWDMATPILIGGKHLGNIFCGQFFFEDEVIDREVFRNQGRRRGFDEEQYLAALDRVPRLSHESVERGTAFLLGIARMLTRLGFSNAKLARLLAERDRLTDSLRESEQRLALAMAATNLGTWDYCPQTGSMQWDARCKELFGLPPNAEGDWNTFVTGIHPDDLARTLRTIESALRPDGDGSYAIEYRTVALNAERTVRWVRATGHAFFNEAREAVRFVGAIEDISERKRAEGELRASEKAFGLAFANNPAAIGVTTLAEGLFRDVNDTWVALFDYQRDEVLGRSARTLSIWPSVESADRFVRMLEDNGSLRNWEQEFVKKSGETFVTQLSAQVLTLRGEKVILSTLVDITERKRAEEALRESEQRLAVAKEAAGLGVYDYNILTGKIEWDARMRPLWGVAPDVPVTFDVFLSGVHPDDRARIKAGLAQAFRPAGTGHYATEFRVINLADGVERWVAATGQASFLQGQPVRVIGTVTDITPQKQAEAALQAAKAAAEAATEAKTRFLANMSHELRTPMNAILGMIDLAIPKTTNPTVYDCLETAKGSADLLLTLLDELLDSAKIESGRLDIEAAPFSLRQMLDQTTRVLFMRASEKGLSFSCEIPGKTPDALLGDRMRLQQVVFNLAGNAIKFTDQGKVEVRVRAVEEDPDVLEFAVRDTGIGIPPDAIQRLFQPFAQADASMARRFGGTGLGLSISKSLVEMMGGRMWVESEPELGSTFYFTVRMPKAESLLVESKVGSELPATAPLQLRILLVEDNAANQKLATYVLQERGHIVHIASDGQEAVDLTERESYDVILMDVQMPGMDGFEATSIIRSRETGERRVPIIAMTAYAMKSDRDRCLAAGMDAYLAKPISSRELIALVERLAAGVESVPSPHYRQPPEPSASVAVFDPPTALERCFNQRDLLVQMIDFFVDDVDKLLPQVGLALQRGNPDEMGRLAHRLKGTISHLAAERARDAARQVERIGQIAGSETEAEAAVQRLEQECQTLKAAVIKYRAASESNTARE
ncbi:MAG: PocR ligand-binding domain-containing protein [Thermoguttaceae bacterium]